MLMLQLIYLPFLMPCLTIHGGHYGEILLVASSVICMSRYKQRQKGTFSKYDVIFYCLLVGVRLVSCIFGYDNLFKSYVFLKDGKRRASCKHAGH